MNRKQKPSLTERIAVGAATVGTALFAAGTFAAIAINFQRKQDTDYLGLSFKPAKVLSYEFRNAQTGPVDDIPATLDMVLEVDGRIVGARKSEPLAAKTGYERLLSQERMPGDNCPSIFIENGYVDTTKTSPEDTLEVKDFVFRVPKREADLYK